MEHGPVFLPQWKQIVFMLYFCSYFCPFFLGPIFCPSFLLLEFDKFVFVIDHMRTVRLYPARNKYEEWGVGTELAGILTNENLQAS